ncbi:hypothetical protein J4Q44_G00032330 [Coregonus suidteri]|uniref:Uncharacterized protein n=1 Tax=Coregonus suidteri TaxID=861788 RepID=A0AAN8R816_9TELE
MMNAKYNQPTNEKAHPPPPPCPPPLLDSYLTTVNMIVYVLYGTYYTPSVSFVTVSLCGLPGQDLRSNTFKSFQILKWCFYLSFTVAIEPIKKGKPYPPGTPCRLKQMLKYLKDFK